MMNDTIAKEETAHNNNSKKIFIPTIGSLGDVMPYLILAKELKTHGHIVWVGVHKRFEQQAQDMGRFIVLLTESIDTIELDGDMDIVMSSTPEAIELQRNPSIFKLSLIKSIFLPLMEKWFNGIVANIKDADLIVLSINSAIVGMSAIEKHPGIKAVAIYPFPCTPTNEFSPPLLSGKSESLFHWINSLKWKMSNYGMSSMYGDKINQLRASINLPAIKLLDYCHNLVSTVATATIYSKYLLPRPLDWSENNQMVGPIFNQNLSIDFKPSEDIVEFLEMNKKEKKLLYIGVGSMMHIMFGEKEQLEFLTVIQAAVLNNNNCKAIVSLSGIEIKDLFLTNNDNNNIFYLKTNIPHTWLFPQLTAAIHHGGAGTTHTSLKFGLPTLILPFGADQPFNGDRVYINKLGPKPIPVRQINVKNLTNAIQDLLNTDEYQTNAKKIGELIAKENGLDHCIKLIESQFM
ncbi:unnamed protein product [Didymodactylos carnosus]|uniref:Glycosyltransferase n=1 Tax=Didymodactylos carnosus TaxID=1234261 RepID=A0A815AK42_9BILA|nr:unnamed protein product [Didymodactylos carnosus]CAF1257881.1 unnamed protein product [Didymodactylos carnosus]CAF3605865.1 unnamed protein product [Didymodactylos carnosus]CAF4032667.1 unnamed protein product [Didymodactylos carnosus]